MVLRSILVIYDRCTSCGVRKCIVACYPDTIHTITALERISRKTCSECRCELGIKSIKARLEDL